MTSPTDDVDPRDRTVRFSLRLHPDEMAAVEDMQERQGGAPLISINTVIAQCVTEAYHYRVSAAGQQTLPVTPAALDAIRWTADELGITVPAALEVLALRGLPHTPSPKCDHQAPGVPAKMPPVQMRPSGAPLPPPPQYATPKPTGLPPVPPVAGQDAIDMEGPDQP
jgi:hypothetical protein